MNASELIDDYVANLTDWRGTTIANIRRIIHEADAKIVEEWKWRGTPVWSHDGIVCLAKAFKDKVKLTFYLGRTSQTKISFSIANSEIRKWGLTAFAFNHEKACRST
jgi:hypothetical protein